MQCKSLFIITILLFLSTACKSDKIVNVPSEEPPPTEPVSYSNQIQPIFNNSCGGGPCHISGVTSGVNLSNYQNTTNSIGSAYGTLIVFPGDAENSPIIDKLEDNPEFGRQMPLTGGKLTNEEVSLIRTWINQGALDN